MISEIKNFFKGIRRKYRKYKRQKQIIRDAYRVLKNSELYKEDIDDFGDIIYILENPKNPYDVLAFIAYMEEDAYMLDVYADNRLVCLWGYNFVRDLFDYLEDKYELSYMTFDCHCCVWECILEDDEEIKGSKGIQSYLQHCHKNKITYKKLQKKCDFCGDDVMKYYNQI